MAHPYDVRSSLNLGCMFLALLGGTVAHADQCTFVARTGAKVSPRSGNCSLDNQSIKNGRGGLHARGPDDLRDHLSRGRGAGPGLLHGLQQPEARGPLEGRGGRRAGEGVRQDRRARVHDDRGRTARPRAWCASSGRRSAEAGHAVQGWRGGGAEARAGPGREGLRAAVRRVLVHARGPEALRIRGRGLDGAVRPARRPGAEVPGPVPEGAAPRGGDGGRAGAPDGPEARGRSGGRDAEVREREDVPELLDGEGRLRRRLQGVERRRASGSRRPATARGG